VRIIILLNPTAKRGKARRLLKCALKVFRQQNVHFDVRESQSSEHLMELARKACEEKPDLIVSAGGDGTHHYVINGLFKSEIPLGLPRQPALSAFPPSDFTCFPLFIPAFARPSWVFPRRIGLRT
jgi:hypothetical protein